MEVAGIAIDGVFAGGTELHVNGEVEIVDSEPDVVVDDFRASVDEFSLSWISGENKHKIQIDHIYYLHSSQTFRFLLTELQSLQLFKWFL